MRLPGVRDPDQSLPSLLPGWLSRLLTVALALAVYMIANTAYLLLSRLAEAVGWGALSGGLPEVFQAMVLSHTGVGLLLAVLLLLFLGLHLPVVWQREHTSSVVSGLFFAAVGITLVVTGLFIFTESASRQNRWAWWLHVACGVLVVVGYAAHRLVSYRRARAGAFGKFASAAGGVLVLLVGAHVLTAGGSEDSSPAGGPDSPGARDREARRWVAGPFSPGGFVPLGFVPPESPFFPSAVTTTSGDTLPDDFLTRAELGVSDDSLSEEVEAYGFVRDAPIGAETCARCHASIVEQWSSSAHRFASFNNPFYEATIDDMRRTADEPNRWVEEHLRHFPERTGDVGRAKSKWCGGCHDPGLTFTGDMGGPVDRASRQAQAGITCLTCHAADTVHDVTGNGNYNIVDTSEDPYLFAGSPEGTIGAFLHDAAVRAKPSAHRRRMLKPLHGEALYCSTCHKVSLREPVNNYRWLRGQDEYDNWHDSGISLNASRTFYLPESKRVCQDCHMPMVPAERGDVAADGGLVRSHRFPAVNTALPYVRGDTAMIRRIERFLRNERLRVDVFAVRGPRREGAAMGIDSARPALPAGDTVTVDVVVRNQGVGHTFPGGTNDSNQGWLEFTVEDGRGRTLAVSGRIGEDGRLDPMAHTFKALILDEEGQPIHKRNAQDIHVAAYKNVIGPGTADLAHYRFRLPPALAGDTLTFRARLLWRKFDDKYSDFAYRNNPEGFRRFPGGLRLPVTEIAADTVRLAVAPVGTERRRATAPEGVSWVRYNDYGIGLLLEGDTRGAVRAFRRVAELAPDRIDGSLNLARAAIRDGDIERAYEHLQRVEEIDPGDARAAWVWGRAHQEDGRYGRAASAYRRVLEAFPDDRAAWRNLGRVLYLDDRYEAALEAFGEVLRIDPEDRIAHYHRMLSLRALGREEEAEEARKAYEYYRIDETAQRLTREYRRAHPGANLMAQPIPIHRLELRAPARDGR